MPIRPVPKLLLALAACTLLGALASCDSDTTTPAEPVPTDERVHDETAAQRWIALSRAIVGRREPGPLGMARTFALVAVAQYNAVVAASAAGPDAGGVRPSESGAAAGASAAVLRAIYPAEEAVVAQQLTDDGAYFPGSSRAQAEGFAAGVRIGETAAAAVLARAARDGSQAVWTGTIPTGPGYWQNAPAPAQPLGPLWGQVRPWVLASGNQFRPAAPPAFGSPAFAAALAEVRQHTDNRTASQLQIAQYWQFGSGPGGPMGHFGAVATQLAAAHHLGERTSARLYAVLYMAMMDASIACWDAKFTYWYIRPHQADPAITTPVGRPNFPAYPSAHSCFSAAAAGVLRNEFPLAARELQAQVDEAGVARLYAGLHFRFDIDAGQTLGFNVARVVLERAPRGNQPISLD